MSNSVEQTTRGYQQQLFDYLKKSCTPKAFCTNTTRFIARKTGATRNVAKKGIQDLVKRRLIRLEFDTDPSGFIRTRRIYLVERSND